jgi:hypothetical protein
VAMAPAVPMAPPTIPPATWPGQKSSQARIYSGTLGLGHAAPSNHEPLTRHCDGLLRIAIGFDECLQR